MSALVLVASTTSLKGSPTMIRFDKPSLVLPGNINPKDSVGISVSESVADTPRNRLQVQNHGGSPGKFGAMRSSNTISLHQRLISSSIASAPYFLH